MKKLLTLAILCALAIGAKAQELTAVKLQAPNMSKGSSLMEAFTQRASAMSWKNEKLSTQDLSTLLWAANGVNRTESGKRTAPSAMNAQDVDVYVFLEEGAYLYNAVANTLDPIAKGDFRGKAVTSQSAQPPVLLVLVSDISRFTRIQDEAARLKCAAMDAGIVSQNIGIYCAGTGLVTRPRASMDMAALKEVLKLSDTQHPMLNHPVGYKQ